MWQQILKQTAKSFVADFQRNFLQNKVAEPVVGVEIRLFYIAIFLFSLLLAAFIC